MNYNCFPGVIKHKLQLSLYNWKVLIYVHNYQVGKIWENFFNEENVKYINSELKSQICELRHLDAYFRLLYSSVVELKLLL